MPNIDVMEYRRQRGLCPNCGLLPPAASGKSYCYVCAGYHRDLSAIRRDEWRASGICIACGQRKAEDGKTKCRQCLERGRADSKRIKNERKEQGLCTLCGRKLQGEDAAFYVTCARCREKIYERKHKAA